MLSDDKAAEASVSISTFILTSLSFSLNILKHDQIYVVKNQQMNTQDLWRFFVFFHLFAK